MVFMEVRIDLGSSRRGDETMGFDGLGIARMKCSKLVDNLETVDLFMWNLNVNIIVRFIEIYKSNIPITNSSELVKQLVAVD